MTYRAVFLTSLIFLSLASGRPGAAAASFDETVAALLSAEKAIEKRDPDAARAAVANAADDVARQLVDWIAYRNSLGSFEEITGFMNRNPDWPSRGRLRLNAERKLVSTMPAAVILDFFALGEPLTDDGAVLYLSALMTGGDKTRAADYARRTWVEMTFDARSETAFRKLAGPTLTSADHLARLDRLLWDGHQNSARRMFPLVSDEYRKLADARIRLRQRLAGVDAAIDRVPVVPAAGGMNEAISPVTCCARDISRMLTNWPPEAAISPAPTGLNPSGCPAGLRCGFWMTRLWPANILKNYMPMSAIRSVLPVGLTGAVVPLRR